MEKLIEQLKKVEAMWQRMHEASIQLGELEGETELLSAYEIVIENLENLKQDLDEDEINNIFN